MSKKVLLIVLFSVLFHESFAQDASRWVDSVFNTLTQEAKIGQLFMVPVSTYAPQDEIDELIDLVQDHGIGGIYITAGGPLSHIKVLNTLQESSKVPLLAGISAEWGLAQTLDSTLGFQKPLVAAACPYDSLNMLRVLEIASQMKRLGLHVNFAPNTDDEIFSDDYLRYSGNDINEVTRRSIAFATIMQSEGILCVAKHLPRSNGNDQIMNDSSLVLNLNKIDTTRLLALKELSNHNVHGILTSYLHYSIQNTKENIPASVSEVFISEILKKNLHFRGLVYADVKHFQNVSRKKRAGEAEVLAFEAGNDVLMNPLNVGTAIKKISKLLKKNKQLQQQLDASVKKILTSKYKVGLNQRKAISRDNVMANLHTPSSYSVKHAIAETSMTLLKNEKNLLPILDLNHNSFLCVSIGRASENEFTHYLSKYARIETRSIATLADTVNVAPKSGDILIVGIFPYATGLEKKLEPWFSRLMAEQKVIIVHFGNPFSLPVYDRADVIITALTDHDFAMSVAPQIIFGALPAKGILPLSINAHYSQGAGMATQPIGRMSFSVPESVGMNSSTLEKIDAIAQEAISTQATPGCQIVVLRKGTVVYEKSFGYQTYNSRIPVTDQTIYDLASLTKVLGTVPTIMHLYERGLLDINKKASVYLPELRTTNKKDLIIKDILTHQSGLLAFIPLWPQTLDVNRDFMPTYYSRSKTENYPLQVAPELFATPAIRDSLWNWMTQSKMVDKPPRTPYSFRYSDLGPWILYRLSERILNQHMEDFLQQYLYDPIGAKTTGYLPLSRFDVAMIAPTENDTIFRKTMVVGTVHDERAALLGGVAGHAGLFSDAIDVAKLGQMLLQKGTYGGIQYFKPGTVELFTKKQYENSRRGLGWDKPNQGDWNSPTSLFSSPATFGHTGFTGTCLWVDPEFDLVFVFLSNRVYPDRSSKLNTANIRSRMQDMIYRSIFDFCQYQTLTAWKK